MTICNKCGEEIEFRYVDGTRTPIHFSGGCTENWRDSPQQRHFSSGESECYPTTCPECGESVYFIRHNGGSVWIDPPLGAPWVKHDCMNPETSPNVPLISSEHMNACGDAEDLIVGVVKGFELSQNKSCAVVHVATPDKKRIILFVRKSKGTLFGEFVIYNPIKSKIFLVRNKYISWNVLVRISRRAVQC